MNAWEIITAHAADTSDAWAALNSQECTNGYTTGTAVDEIPFSLDIPILIGATLQGKQIMSSLSSKEISAIFESVSVSSTIETEPIVIREGC